MPLALALDGPFNGEYISDAVAFGAGYSLIEWQAGEKAWLHSQWSADQVEEEVGDEWVRLETERRTKSS